MEASEIIIGAVAAVLVGISKSGLPGLGILVVPIMAIVLPARESVGALLPMLIAGDFMAILWFRRHARWKWIRALLPWVAGGMAAAAWTLSRIDSSHLRPLLGALVLAMIGLELARTRLGWDRLPHHPAFVASVGAAAGFSTTLGNAAGPVMNIYLLSRGLPKVDFVGTQAWFFFLVNLTKVPIYASQGMITASSLKFDAAMIPLILLGAWIGTVLLRRLSDRWFYTLVVILSAIGGLRLLWP